MTTPIRRVMVIACSQSGGFASDRACTMRGFQCRHPKAQSALRERFASIARLCSMLSMAICSAS